MKCVPQPRLSCNNTGNSSSKINCENTDPSRASNNSHKSASKVLVPKLKLDILPNYHKKSEKSLNDSLLAIYNEKHGATKKVI